MLMGLISTTIFAMSWLYMSMVCYLQVVLIADSKTFFQHVLGPFIRLSVASTCLTVKRRMKNWRPWLKDCKQNILKRCSIPVIAQVTMYLR